MPCLLLIPREICQIRGRESGVLHDYTVDQIEVGFSVVPGWQGRGLATEALKKVLEYLTENEGILSVTAWCADENIGSKRVLEKAGMKLVRIEKDGLAVEDRVYDKLVYEYRKRTDYETEEVEL